MAAHPCSKHPLWSLPVGPLFPSPRLLENGAVGHDGAHLHSTGDTCTWAYGDFFCPWSSSLCTGSKSGLPSRNKTCKSGLRSQGETAHWGAETLGTGTRGRGQPSWSVGCPAQGGLRVLPDKGPFLGPPGSSGLAPGRAWYGQDAATSFWNHHGVESLKNLLDPTPRCSLEGQTLSSLPDPSWVWLAPLRSPAHFCPVSYWGAFTPSPLSEQPSPWRGPRLPMNSDSRTHRLPRTLLSRSPPTRSISPSRASQPVLLQPVHGLAPLEAGRGQHWVF